LTTCVFAALLSTSADAISPILIVPGVEGSQLYKKDSPCHNLFGICPWKGVWLGAEACISISSVLKDLTLVYDSAKGSFHNQSGLAIKAFGFGDTCKVEYLVANPIETSCLLQLPVGEYFHTLVKHFTALGYKRGQTIRSAPYDWRLSPVNLQASGYYSNVKALIEQMYKDGGNKKVTLVAHSMGGPVTLYFLNNVVTQAWKDTYVNAFVTLAGAWSGGNVVVKAEISGDLLDALSSATVREICDFPDDIALRFRSAGRTYPSMAVLLPKPSVWGNKVLVTTPKRTYTAYDYQALFNDMGYPQGFDIYSGIAPINAGFPPPNVPTYCFYGTAVATPESFVYGSGFPDSAPSQVINGDGDGTVNRRSAEVCLKWKTQQQQPFGSSAFPGVDHLKMVKDSNVLRAVDRVVLRV
ncbi:hypothetical protein EMCRGX_G007026, partial [Ephydatia muelleri]